MNTLKREVTPGIIYGGATVASKTVARHLCWAQLEKCPLVICQSEDTNIGI
jgi:hypothetical protein